MFKRCRLHPLKNILNKILWDNRSNSKDYLVTYVHRGAPSDSKKIPFTSIRKIGKSWFSLLEVDDEIQIPFHRIITVQNIRTGEILWQKRQRAPRLDS